MSFTQTTLTPLSRDFFARPTDEVARGLLGRHLVREADGKTLIGKIVEVEAYFGRGDDASHAARGRTPRNSIMFGPPGFAYVYLNYGVHWLLNAVTEEEGTAGAVLIRAIEPLGGIEAMLENRPVRSVKELGNGPGKLTKALLIGPCENGADLTNTLGRLYVAEGEKVEKIGMSTRVGITLGTEHLLRFFVEDNAFVSGKP